MGSEQFPDHNPKMLVDWTICSRPQTEEELKCEGFLKHRIDFYNDHSVEYDHDSYLQNYTGAFYVAMTAAKYLEGNYGAKILDIGGGTGFVPVELKKVGEFNNVDVIDPADKLVKNATDRGLYKDTFFQYFDTDTGLPSESYDAVVCAGAFVPGCLKPNSVPEMARLLKPGGLLVLGVRTWCMETDRDLKTLPDELEKLVDDGTWDQLERSIVPRWHAGMPGIIFAYVKKQSA